MFASVSGSSRRVRRQVEQPGAKSAGGSYRWTVLAVGTGAQAATSAYFQGLAAVGPALREAEHLSLAGLGLLLGAPTAGMVLTLLLWGRATDRFGERTVMGCGLLGAAAGLAAASKTQGLWPLAFWLFLTGSAGASVNAASGRAVLSWFPDRQRGVAMGVRQTAVPLGAALAALGLPPLVNAAGVPGGLRALAGICVLAALVVVVWVREPAAPVAAARRPLPATDEPADGYSVFRDGRLWRLAAASSLLVIPQFTIVTFMVEVLHGYRHVPASSAALVLALAQLAGGIGRLIVGHWADRVRSQLRPLRALAVAMAVGGLILAGMVNAPLLVLEVALVAEATLVICWNGLAYTAAGEIPPAGRVGTALAFQNTANFVSVAATPSIAGLVINTFGFASTFALMAIPATTSAVVLSRLEHEGPRSDSGAPGSGVGKVHSPFNGRFRHLSG